MGLVVIINSVIIINPWETKMYVTLFIKRVTSQRMPKGKIHFLYSFCQNTFLSKKRIFKMMKISFSVISLFYRDMQRYLKINKLLGTRYSRNGHCSKFLSNFWTCQLNIRNLMLLFCRNLFSRKKVQILVHCQRKDFAVEVFTASLS